MGSQARTPTERRPHRYLQSTTASETECRNCRARILNGWDEGLLVRVDLDPLRQITGTDTDRLDRPGELREIHAILDGRLTYVRTSSSDLVLRTAQRITDGHPIGHVHAQHLCPPANLLECLR